ncbi:MAG: polysaccharide deacetylase family protein [Gemmatimonadota bacterium]
MKCLEAGRPFPERAVVITFDDGYRHVLRTALPVLRRYGLPAAVFLPRARRQSAGAPSLPPAACQPLQPCNSATLPAR